METEETVGLVAMAATEEASAVTEEDSGATEGDSVEMEGALAVTEEDSAVMEEDSGVTEEEQEEEGICTLVSFPFRGAVLSVCAVLTCLPPDLRLGFCERVYRRVQTLHQPVSERTLHPHTRQLPLRMQHGLQAGRPWGMHW